ncbi:MAG TPA: alanine racemase [Kofleriaceae bacterium]|nr:alanine racemase [Kofleriaceae bacterium]
MIRRTRVEIDLQAIVGNAAAVRAVTGTSLYAVVKADAYGHGAVSVATALAQAKAAAGFCVSLVEEGVALRDAGVTLPILVMGASQVGGEDDMVAAKLTPVISSDEELEALVDVAKRRNVAVDAHLKVDTGMGRLGVAVERAAELAVVAGRNGVRIVGLMTHFANADTDEAADAASLTRTQLARFAEVDRAVTAAGAPIQVRHAANSSGALVFPQARFDFVRCGIALWGNGRWAHPHERDLASDVARDPKHHVQPAMRLVTAIAQLRRVPVGASVGYGATWRAARESRIAVLPCGYADGLPRRASGHAQAAVRGRRVPLVGLISMDIALADVTDVPEAAVGDAAVLLGRASGGQSITAAEYGGWAGLSEYEVTCGMSKRVPRTYVEAR